MEYHFRETEKNWQKYWADKKTFRAENNSSKPKYYVLDMFPYPSGAGLHVGHPLGYIASDIYARYKRLKGFNVLHPMGYDSFGLPAEQYAIQTGQHPAITTDANIARYREQLDKIGFSFDWDREVRTSDPNYYRWTQWIFIQLFNSWYNSETNKTESIDKLIQKFSSENTEHHINGNTKKWNELNEKEKADVLMDYRIAYLGEAYVNWCPALGTVLANDEVKDGVSERGGYPVERKLMKQWSMRITAYADRLLNDLEKIDWSDSIKEAQRNWIGKSEGASLEFKIQNSVDTIEVFTTRPETVFGISFLTLAPEHELAEKITTSEKKPEVEAYIAKARNRSERERQAEVNTVSGVFTGTYAIHPFTGEEIPVWVGDYVLAGYGTGAVMAVPAHDERDFRFASFYQLPIKQVIIPTGEHNFSKTSWDEKEGTLINSSFLDGLNVKDAIKKCIAEIEKRKLGKGKINYRLRDAVFGRQRYWGEPIPVYYKNGIAHTLPENKLPLHLPAIDKFLPTEEGEPPLARSDKWFWNEETQSVDKSGFPIETTTMPGWAGSSWYYLRYMDAHNEKEFASADALNYWQNVDLYIGGSEHATGHLLYVRFWTKALKDLGYIQVEEPAKKLINQGMIQGRSSLVYRIKNTNKFVSFGLKEKYETTPVHVDVNFVANDELDIESFKAWRDDFKNAEFILEDGKYLCGNEIEKMSKSKHNVVTPDVIVEKYGADCLRMYEMFLGPLEQSKPWNTNGIAGVSGFIRKLWKLYHSNDSFYVSDDAPTKAELKTLHKTIKKVQEDIEKFSFNTSVSSFMICVNELTDLKCNKRAILEPLAIILSPYAPHIAEELWKLCGHEPSIAHAEFPTYNESYLVEDAFEYPVSVNGKTRFKINLPLQISKDEIEQRVLAAEEMQKWTNGSAPKKVIVVPGRIVNVVI
ncbi:MAG: Leucine--tRNA ligase [Bacteroidetes bacterium ADurb.Bin141]|nr:MAG: Leucine--tRNA ligase [Bacteroidetes bacterium ADurb.Bin141]